MVLTTIRKIPAAMTTTPMAVNIPANWAMSPAGGSIELSVTVAPTIMSINPNTFSMIATPMGVSSLMPEPSRLNFTVPRLILI